MALKIRLRQQGCNNRPFYRLVVMDVKTRRDGKYVEALGWYNPFAKESTEEATVNVERVKHWISVGAQMSDTVEALLRRQAPNAVAFKEERQSARREKDRVKSKVRRQRRKVNTAKAA